MRRKRTLGAMCSGTITKLLAACRIREIHNIIPFRLELIRVLPPFNREVCITPAPKSARPNYPNPLVPTEYSIRKQDSPLCRVVLLPRGVKKGNDYSWSRRRCLMSFGEEWGASQARWVLFIYLLCFPHLSSGAESIDAFHRGGGA